MYVPKVHVGASTPVSCIRHFALTDKQPLTFLFRHSPQSPTTFLIGYSASRSTMIFLPHAVESQARIRTGQTRLWHEQLLSNKHVVREGNHKVLG